MAKTFAPRVAKRERKVIPLSSSTHHNLFKLSDQKLLQGAKLSEVYLKEIKVREQVRTKFNDASLKDLADNIRANGLIQPLVLHRQGNIYTLICGERRFRAMNLIKMEKCPCFVLQDKSREELMAIQFSENSSREELHYIDKADGIFHYQKTTRASEREITKTLGITKSEVHRSLMIARLPSTIKESAKRYNIEKYVLLELYALPQGRLRKKIEEKIMGGEIKKRGQLRSLLNGGKATKKARSAPPIPSGVSANLLLKAMKKVDMDKSTRERLNNILEESVEIIGPS